MRARTLGRLIAVPIGVAALLVASATNAGAVPVTPRTAPQAFIDLIDSSVDANIGQEISTISNDNPTTWPAEDPDVVLTPSEQLRYRLYAYDFSYLTLRYSRNLWIGHLFEGAAYLPS